MSFSIVIACAILTIVYITYVFRTIIVSPSEVFFHIFLPSLKLWEIVGGVTYLRTTYLPTYLLQKMRNVIN